MGGPLKQANGLTRRVDRAFATQCTICAARDGFFESFSSKRYCVSPPRVCCVLARPLTRNGQPREVFVA
jgi:hypothetical protein